MSKEYCMEAGHSFVTVNVPANGRTATYIDDSWRMPYPIVLHVETRVWIAASYTEVGQHPDILRVGDGVSNGYDQHGNTVVSIPATWCRFYTDEEANSIAMCLDADDQLLSYAI